MKKRLINFFSIIFYHAFKLFKIRLFKLNVGRIGHLVELYFLYSLCLKKNKKNKFFCYIYYEDKISNNYLFDKFKNNLNIIPFKIGSFIDRLIDNSDLSENKKNTLRLFDFQNKKSGWENYNGEILSIATTNNDELYFENFLKSNNIKYPYVCINLWSFKHLEENYPKVDWSHHKLRMSNDENFIDLINYITTRNYNVIIMGHDNSRFKNLKNEKVFDYSSIRKDILDFFLIKNCYGYISDCTGLDYLAFALKKPMLLNSPFLNYFFNKHQKIIYILKNQYILNKNKQLNLKEMLYEYNTMFKVKSEFYENNKIMLQDNNPLEILEAYKQLESLIENNRCEKRIKNYSERFWSEYKKFLDDKKYREKNHYDSGPYPIIYDNIKLD